MSDSKKDWPVGPGRSGLDDPHWKGIAKIKERLRIKDGEETKKFELAAEKAAKKKGGKK